MKIKKRNRKCSYNWSPAKERLIIDLWKSNFNDFQSQPRRHEQIYEKISFQLADCGVLASKIEVKNKIKNLYQKYKTEKSLDASTWPQFDVLDSFLQLIFRDKIPGQPAAIDRKQTKFEPSSISYDDNSINEPIIKTEIDDDDYEDEEFNSSTPDINMSSYLPEISVHEEEEEDKSPKMRISSLRSLKEHHLQLPPDRPPPPPPSLIPMNHLDYNPHHHLGLMRTNRLPATPVPIVMSDEIHAATSTTTATSTPIDMGGGGCQDGPNGVGGGGSSGSASANEDRINFKLEILNELKKINNLAELEYQKQVSYMDRANELNERSVQALEKANDIQEKILNFLVNKF